MINNIINYIRKYRSNFECLLYILTGVFAVVGFMCLALGCNPNVPGGCSRSMANAYITNFTGLNCAPTNLNTCVSFSVNMDRENALPCVYTNINDDGLYINIEKYRNLYTIGMKIKVINGDGSTSCIILSQTDYNVWLCGVICSSISVILLMCSGLFVWVCFCRSKNMSLSHV